MSIVTTPTRNIVEVTEEELRTGQVGRIDSGFVFRRSHDAPPRRRARFFEYTPEHDAYVVERLEAFRKLTPTKEN